MSTKDELERIFPEEKQIGGKHYKMKIQPWTFIRENDLNPFQANVIKYAVRYEKKNGIEDLNKIIHYCELEIAHMRKTWDK
jgi:hypothetical protein